jgi:hypothetical protein
MTKENVTQIIGKALVEPEFHSLLFSNPEAALSGYDLTEEERTGLSSMKAEDFDAFASLLEQRESKTGLHSAFPGLKLTGLDVDRIRAIVVTYG